MKRFVATLTIWMSCLSVSALVGCASLTRQDASDGGSFFKMPWSADKPEIPEPYPNPVKLAVTWAPDTLTQSGRVTTRGFGGRVFFYDEKSRPVAVDGTLVVHGFDESAGDPKKAMKRYEFTPEQFTRHFSQSDLGASYSIWVPWDAVGGKQTRISLVATFQTPGGKSIQSIPSTVLLPGHRSESEADVARRFAPEYRKWKRAAAGELPPTSGLTTTTITRPKPQQRTEPQVAPEVPSSTWNIARRTGNTPAVDVAMRSDGASAASVRTLAAGPGRSSTVAPTASDASEASSPASRPSSAALWGSGVPARPAAMRLPPLDR